MTPRIRKLVTAVLSWLSVASFVQLAQLLVPFADPIVLGFFGLYISLSVLRLTRSAYRERSGAQFDLTAPTAFENGVLVLQSRSGKCAAFFAMSFRPKAIRTEAIRRTLTTLLKVLPHSSVLSVEITKQNECFASLYLKVDKSDVLQRTRELTGSLLSSLRTLFGESEVRALCDDELWQHLALGIPGRMHCVCRSTRLATILRTDAARRWLSAATAVHLQADLLQRIDTVSNHDGETYRVIFALRSQEQRKVVVSSKLLVITTNDRPNSDWSFLASSPRAVRRIPASEIRRKLGDIMTRNIFTNDESQVSFEEAADELLSFLALWNTRQSGSESGGSRSQATTQTTTNVLEWRTALSAIAEELGITLERNILLSAKRFPLRLDARLGSTLFKIIPDCDGDHARLQWLMNQLTDAVESETASNLALLTSGHLDAPPLAELLSKNPDRERIQSLTSVDQLRALLLERRAAATGATNSLA
jgi:hypothetical protein